MTDIDLITPLEQAKQNIPAVVEELTSYCSMTRSNL